MEGSDVVAAQAEVFGFVVVQMLREGVSLVEPQLEEVLLEKVQERQAELWTVDVRSGAV